VNNSPPTINSASSYSCWHECPEKWRLRYKEKLKPLDMPLAFQFGQWAHTVLETYYRGGDPLEVVDLYERTKAKELLSERDVQKYNQTRAMLEGIARTYPDWAQKLDAKYEILEIEGAPPGQTLDDLAEHDEELDLWLRLDLLIRVDGKTFVMDHKTVSKGKENNLLETVGHNFQSLAYVAAKKADGIIHNLITKPMIRRRQLESLEQFCERMVEQYTEGEMYQRHRTLISWQDAYAKVKNALACSRLAQRSIETISPNQYPL